MRLGPGRLFIAVMVAIPLTLSWSALAGSAGEIVPEIGDFKGLSGSGYPGNYPPSGCFGPPTSNPPAGYSPGCDPPSDWLAYCQAKFKSFNVSNGYYLRFDGLHHACR